MEAKDTEKNTVSVVAERTAGITANPSPEDYVKAGMDYCVSVWGGYLFAVGEHHRKAGIKEVVEWMRTHQMPDEPSSEPYPGLVLISKVQMQAKLKELGIE